MPCYVRPMRQEDISQVTEIDREAFPTLLPPANYHNELKNRLAHYIVACDEEKTIAEDEVKVNGFSRLMTGVKQLFNRGFVADELPPSARQYVIGFAGFWVMVDEAHITNIVVRETYRRQGIGELLLISIIDMARELKARSMTLEVRVSNTAAQELYYKYGFTQVGLRRGYYTDNREDGILMSVGNITSALFQANLQQLKQAHSQKWGETLHQGVLILSPAQPGT